MTISNVSVIMPMNVRCYLSSGAPVADVTNDTGNFYIGPFGGGNLVSLPDTTGNNFQVFQLSEIGTAIPSALFRIYDVFLSSNSGAPAVTTTAWDSGGQTTGSVTGITAANPAVVTAANSFAGGELVGFAGIVGTIGTNTAMGLNGKVFKVASANSTTFTLEAGCDTTGLVYTSSGTYYQIPTARTTGLTWQNGLYLQTGNLNRVYVATIMAGSQGTSGRADDNTSLRLVWNYFNRVKKLMLAQDTTASWTYTNGTQHPRNTTLAVGTSRNEILIGVVEEPIDTIISVGTNGYGNNAVGAILLNSVGPTLTNQAATVYAIANISIPSTGSAPIMPLLGYNFAQSTEASHTSVGTCTFQGYNATNNVGTQSIQPLFATTQLSGRF